jgi:hypothetical protein
MWLIQSPHASASAAAAGGWLHCSLRWPQHVLTHLCEKPLRSMNEERSSGVRGVQLNLHTGQQHKHDHCTSSKAVAYCVHAKGKVAQVQLQQSQLHAASCSHSGLHKTPVQRLAVHPSPASRVHTSHVTVSAASTLQIYRNQKFCSCCVPGLAFVVCLVRPCVNLCLHLQVPLSAAPPPVQSPRSLCSCLA